MLIERRKRRTLVSPENGQSWDHPQNAGLAPLQGATIKGLGVCVVDEEAAAEEIKRIMNAGGKLFWPDGSLYVIEGLPEEPPETAPEEPSKQVEVEVVDTPEEEIEVKTTEVEKVEGKTSVDEAKKEVQGEVKLSRREELQKMKVADLRSEAIKMSDGGTEADFKGLRKKELIDYILE